MISKLFLLGGLSCLLGICSSVSEAMYLDEDSTAEITTDPNHQVYGYEQTFAVSGDVAVWVDNRDPVPRIYRVNLSDPNHFEFEVDLDAPGANLLAMSGFRVTYPVQEVVETQYLRVADIRNQDAPFLFDVTPQIPYISYFDIYGPEIAYVGNDPENNYRDTLYAVNITDPNNAQQVSVHVLPEYASVRGLTMANDRMIWSLENWNEGTRAVQVADITNPAEPNIATASLPAEIFFGNLDASESWLVARGQDEWQDCLFAVHNYQDVNDWSIRVLWRDGDNGEHLMSGPCVDGPIAAWVTTTRLPSLADQDGLFSQNEYRLKSAYLMGNGTFTVSTLLTGFDELDAASVSGRQVVWSARSAEAINLFKASMVLTCGDWGYKAGDLDKNCQVDLRDFAIFARDWLSCTVPDDEDCEFGS